MGTLRTKADRATLGGEQTHGAASFSTLIVCHVPEWIEIINVHVSYKLAWSDFKRIEIIEVKHESCVIYINSACTVYLRAALSMS